MTAAEWARVKDLFEGARPLSEAERERYLAGQAAEGGIMEEVRSLLATYDDLPEFLERGAGRRIGAWRLTREIGRGGMGVVWEAQRADDQYQQRAAVKLLPAGLLSEAAIARFRNERQILASLDHPSIARLLDGGTLEDGSPYLAMEYIEGAALDVWCGERHPDLRTRLQVFRTICGAVEYAHRRLVIHRDLKPANILVTAEGMPKLLDFGIAKLMDAEGEVAQPTTRLLTPEFASPEQLRGGAITTSSDIFALGGLLYLLLTGRKPFTAPEGDTLGVMRAVCEEDPPLPKADGELDAIVLQALRKDPDERYHSARALADDIRAWLEGREVSAVRQPWWRRMARVSRRHKTQSAAVGLAVVSLLAGSGVSLWQASVARHQRERAERQFGEVRRFSRSVLFELHEAIRNLPGATAARNLLLERATEFLDGLSADPAADAALRLELAEGYRRLGQVQGGEFSENLGRRDAAIQSFRKAVRLSEGVFAGGQQVDAGLILLSSYDDLARALLEKHEAGEAERWHEKQAELCRRLESRYSAEPRVRLAVADDYSARAAFRTQVSDYAKAKELYRRALAIYGDLKATSPQYAFACKRLGALLIVNGTLDEAERCYRTALSIEDAGIAAAPGDQRRRLDRTFTVSDLALILKKKHDLAGAAKLYEEVLETRRAAFEADPADVRNLRLTASAALKLAAAYCGSKRHHEAIGLGREALRLRERSMGISNDYAERRDTALARVQLAYWILVAGEDSGFRAAPGERAADARILLQQAAPAVPKAGAGQTLSPADQELKADFEAASQYLMRAR